MAAFATQHEEDLTARLTSHAVASIGAADHFSLPFPHVFFRDFFPSDFYVEMISKWPTSGFGPSKGDGTRLALWIYGDNVESIDPSLRDAWRAVSRTLTSVEVERAVRSKLRDGLEIRARGDKVSGPDALKFAAKPILYLDRDGYQIRPHSDTRKKVVTMQLYCPADNSQENLGTTFYQTSLKGLAHPESYFLEPVKTLPFLPNVGYAFVVLKAYHSLAKMSWHGRPRITAPIDKPRASIFNTFYVAENVGF